MNAEFEKIVKEDSPWHDPSNTEWYLRDGALREVIEADKKGLYEPPKIKFFLERDFFRQLIDNPDEYGVVILRGPRRIGKTSTLKYLIKEFLDRKIDPNYFVYLSLDRDELFIKNGKKRFLRELIKTTIETYRKGDKPLIIILDEVTFYEGWARALKNLIDEGVIGPGIGVIATGSYSLDLSSAKRELSGRFGPLGEKFSGDLFFFPRRFIEVAESSLGEEFKNFVARNFGKFGRRAGMIEYLTGAQTKSNNLRFNYEWILNQLIDNYYDGLHDLFENIYTYTGGYPKSFYDAIISKREGEIRIDDARYRDDIYNLLITDSKKFDLSEDVLGSILQKIEFPSMQISEEHLAIQNVKKDEMQKYIHYLRASGLFEFTPCISSPSQIDVKNLLVTPSREKMKLVVTDSAAFISIYLCSRGITYDILEKSKTVISENRKIRELLFESIVLSHLIRSPIIRRSPLIENVGYILFEEKEVVDALAWYVNWKNELILLAIEAKSKGIKIKEIEEKSRILREEFNIKRLIVVSNNKEIEINKDYIIIPMEVSLLFL